MCIMLLPSYVEKSRSTETYGARRLTPCNRHPLREPLPLGAPKPEAQCSYVEFVLEMCSSCAGIGMKMACFILFLDEND